MRGGAVRRLVCLAVALGALAMPATAAAQRQDRIVNGQPASPGEYPAQGALKESGDFICGGTLVSNRFFVTAAHCVTDQNGTPLPLANFSVNLGSTNRDGGTVHTFSARAIHEAYDADTANNDVALLTLSTPASPALEPMQIIETDEDARWAPGERATIIGWGAIFTFGPSSQTLLEATAPMRSDSFCADAYAGQGFNPATMVCAGDGTSDTCQGDSGGPLMVSDGAFLALAGVTSWGGLCADPTQPGVYTRLGADALNTWLTDRVPTADAAVSDFTPQAGQTVTFTASAQNPVGPALTDFAWDFDSDGATDATGATANHAYPADGRFVARVRATGTGADEARAKVLVAVGPEPTPEPTPSPTPNPTPSPTPTPTPTVQPTGPLATILASGRPLVRRGRFNLRINFARTAPRGTAVIEVFRLRRLIGITRTRVLRGGSKRVRVKVTRTGRRMLRRSRSGRVRTVVRVRVGRQVLRTKRVTIRRARARR